MTFDERVAAVAKKGFTDRQARFLTTVPDLVWLGTADEKGTHLLALTRIAEADLPHVTTGEGERQRVRYFPDRLPDRHSPRRPRRRRVRRHGPDTR